MSRHFRLSHDQGLPERRPRGYALNQRLTPNMKMKSVAVVAGVAIVGALLLLYERQRATPHSTLGPASGQRQTHPISAVGSSRLTTAAGKVLTDAVVPATVRPILALSHESSAVRWAAVRALGRRLNHAEAEALYGYLRGHEADAPGPMRGVIKNDVILALKSQEPPPQGVGRCVAEHVLRQGARPRHPRLRPSTPGHRVQTVCRENSASRSAMGRDDGCRREHRGTALIGLSRLAQHNAASQPGSAGGTGFQPVSANDGSEMDTARLTRRHWPSPLTDRQRCGRLTALQVCAELGIKDVLPAAASRPEAPPACPSACRPWPRGGAGRRRPGPSAKPPPHGR